MEMSILPLPLLLLLLELLLLQSVQFAH